jgi:hypothetical protein
MLICICITPWSIYIPKMLSIYSKSTPLINIGAYQTMEYLFRSSSHVSFRNKCCCAKARLLFICLFRSRPWSNFLFSEHFELSFYGLCIFWQIRLVLYSYKQLIATQLSRLFFQVSVDMLKLQWQFAYFKPTSMHNSTRYLGSENRWTKLQ